MIEIDLRIYILAILKKWKWLAGFAVLAAIIAFAFASLLPKTYTATSVVVTQPSKFAISFDDSIQNNRQTPPYKAILDLANSTEILRQTFDASDLAANRTMTFAAFKEQVRAKTGSDQSWITLSVSMSDPALAADLANSWAKFVVAEANRLYNPNDPSQLAVWQAQLDSAKAALDSASQALVEFKATDQSGIVNNGLQSLYNQQAEFFTLQRLLSATADNVVVIQEQLQGLPDEELSPLGGITVLFLQVQSLDNVVVSGPLSNPDRITMLSAQSVMASNSFSFNLQSDVLPETVGEQRRLLDQIGRTIDRRLELVSDGLEEIEVQVLELQKQYELAVIQESQLSRAYDQASILYSSLKSKYDEVLVASNIGDDIVQVVEKAISPTRPENTNSLIIALATMILAVLLGIFVIVLSVWWNSVMKMKSEPLA
ncbi:MAG: Wzz/FepE/Etk N-terminal domain-containing protein [Chloroflexota bacterium]